jgi:hypothetical protein
MFDPRRHDKADRKGCGTPILIGAFVAGAVAMIGLVALAFIVPWMIDRAVEAYTDAEPIEMNAAELPPEQREALDMRVEEFRESIDAGGFTRPLILTEDEINGVLAEEVDPRDGAVQLALLPGRVQAFVSLPINADLPLGPWSRDLSGRYLNGVATVEIGISDSRLDFSITDFDVKGKKLPGYALEALEREVEKSGALDDEEVREYLDRASELRVEHGRIVLTPKSNG